MRKSTLSLLLVFILILVSCTPQEDSTPETGEAETDNLTGVIVIGDIDADDPISKIERFQPVADYLAENLSEFGIGSGEVRIAPDIDTMAEWMANGEVHVYYDSLYPAMVVSEQSGAIPTLRRWKDGSATYHSVIFALADSGIQTLDDLQGRIVGYDNPASTSGYLLPTAYLLSNGFTLRERLSDQASVGEDEIGYLFTNDDDNTIEMVLSGRLDAGVVDNITYLDDIPFGTREQLVILGETDEVARQVVLMSQTLDEDVRDAVATILTELTDSNEGLTILAELKTDRFDTFPDGADTALEALRELYDIVINAE